MDMEKYSRLVDEFAEANCHVKEEDIVRKVHSGNKSILRPLSELLHVWH